MDFGQTCPGLESFEIDRIGGYNDFWTIFVLVRLWGPGYTHRDREKGVTMMRRITYVSPGGDCQRKACKYFDIHNI